MKLITGLALLVSLGAALVAARANGSTDETKPATPAASTRLDTLAVSKRALPAISGATADAVRTAAPKASKLHTAAWGDPSLGCFSVGISMQVRGKPGDAEHFARTVLALPRAKTTKFSQHGGSMSFAFERGDFRGWVSTRVEATDGAELVDVIAGTCFYNQRAPKRCAELCRQTKQRFEATR